MREMNEESSETLEQEVEDLKARLKAETIRRQFFQDASNEYGIRALELEKMLERLEQEAREVWLTVREDARNAWENESTDWPIMRENADKARKAWQNVRDKLDYIKTMGWSE